MKRVMFRKLMAASLATAMVAGLAGCGNDSGASGPSNSEPSSDSNVTSEAGGNSGDSGNSGSSDDGGNSGSVDDGGEVSKYPILKDANGNKYDLGGQTIKIYSWFGEGTDLDTPYYRALNEYREWAQQEYNFTFEWDSNAGGWGDFQNLGEIAQGTFYQQDELAMILLPDASFNLVLSAAEQNLLWDMDSLGVFDFSEERWTRNGVSDLFKAGSGVYACAVSFPEPRGGVYFNATLLQNLTGITPDELYDLQAKGEWTWEKFEEICEKIYQNGDTDGDGVLDYYAVCANGRYMTSMAMYSNNTSYFDLGDDGKFVYRADAPATLEALEWQRKIRMAPYWCPNPYTDPEEAGAHWDYFYEAFDVRGEYVFLIDEAYQMNAGQQLNATDENNAGEYGFLMFPMGPSSGNKYINCYHDNILVLPKCYTEEEAKTIAAAIQIIYADVVPGYEGYNPRIDGYESGVYHERVLTETLTRIMSENAFIDSGKLLPGLDTAAAFDDNSLTISEALAAVETQWKTAIDEYNNR